MEFPDLDGLAQDEEWCRVTVDGEQRSIRFHEYAELFSVPGLYEELFYGRLECSSPKTMIGLLHKALKAADVAPASLRCIDLGAGNGMVGAELRELDVRSVVGVDILPEAAHAADRDRPGVYRDYVVADLTALPDSARERLLVTQPNLFVSVAALGFGDIPPQAFAAAWNLVSTPSWAVFNIKHDFLGAKHKHGFSLLVQRLRDEGLFEVHEELDYQHRLALDGSPLRYTGLVGFKTGPIPDAWLPSLLAPLPA